ncbi:MAG: TrkH family potassium uptake protein [Clostridia bacterium]|nr:TrkH family potassium uptake protein [Clostridia bacterium]
MRLKSVLYVLGKILFAAAAILLLPAVCAIIYKESPLPFLLPSFCSLVVGFVLTLNPKKHDRSLFAKDGFICVGFAWILMSTVGALPFLLSGETSSFASAFFESVSGFTTTGSSIFSNVEALPKSILLWRSLTQWVGGMGVLVFLLAVMPKSDNKQSRYMHLMRAEVPGPSVDKLVPKLAETARVMYGLYFALTLAQIVMLTLGDMNLFEAVNHSLATASTGGFGVKNNSIASYSAYSQYVIAVVMIIFGTNFNLFYLLVIGQFVKVFKNEELKWYLSIFAVATAFVAGNIFLRLYSENGFEFSFRHAFFQVASIMTTSGFSSIDFNVWPSLSHLLLVLLMFCGGCAGSTAGGIKVSRIMLLVKNGKREIKYISQPKAIISVKMNGKAVDNEIIRGATSFIIMYGTLFVLSAFLITAIDGVDPITGFTSVATSINNVGPGLGQVGPAENFGFYSGWSKLILCFNMLAGRLELFPILILFSPTAYKKHA